MSEAERVGPYLLGPLIAEGGMARVFTATSTESGARVALKLPVLPGEGLPDELNEQLRHEVQAMMRLSHPHVLPVLDWGASAQGLLYLAMPLVEGRPLREVTRDLDDHALMRLFDQLLDALAYVHDRGVVHRDIKPRNILISEDGSTPHLWLTDFGIAALEGSPGLRSQDGPAGTPMFMAPEQVHAGVVIGPQADLYAVGVLLYLLFEGARPFAGKTVDEVAQSRRLSPRPSFSAASLRTVPPGLEAIVQRLLDEDPLCRYPSASSLRAALAALAPSAQSKTDDRVVCLECGEPLPVGAAFCPMCDAGAPTFIDSAPSSRSVPLGEEQAVATLAIELDPAHRPLVAALLERASAHVRWLGEGSVVAALGARGPAGNELTEAADLGLSIGALARAKVGVGLGTISTSHGNLLDLSADAAQALARSAEPGQVRLDASLSGELRAHRVETTSHGLWIVGPQAPERERMSDARLRTLLDLAEQVQRERRAQAVALLAPAGMGKSLALEDLAERLERADQPWTVLSATATSEPLGALSVALRAWTGAWPGASRAEIATELEARTGDAACALAAAAVLSSSAPLETGARARALDALGALLAQMATRAPLLIAIDDAGALDDASRELCALALDRLASLPLLIVGSTRNEASDEPTWLAGARPIELPPLGDEDAQIALRSLGDLADAERAAILRLAGGHPQRLLEIARLWQRYGTMPAAASETAIAQARLESLSETERRVAELAAICGPTLWVMELLSLAEPDLRARVHEATLVLLREGMLETVERSSVPGTRELRFASQATAELARASVPLPRRREVHAGCARWLERYAPSRHEEIAAHWRAAAQPLRAAAIDARAGKRAEAIGSVREALEHYRRALAAVDGAGSARSSLGAEGAPLPLDVPGLLAAIARVAVTAGEPALAREAAERALDVDEPARAILRGHARYALAECARMGGEAARALEPLEAALAELGPRGDPILRAQLLGRRGWILGYVLGRNDEGRRCGEEALRLVESLEVPAIQSHLYSELGANELRAGRWDRQLECNRQALALAKQAGELHAQVRAHINLSVCFTNRGKLAQAAEHAIEASAISVRTGLHRSRIIGLNNLGLIRLDQGELDEAQRLFEEVIELCARHGVRDVLYETLPSLGRVLLAKGDLGAALERAENGEALSRAEGNPVGVALALRVAALVASARGDVAHAAVLVDRALEALGPTGDAYERAVSALVQASLHGAPTDSITAELRSLGADPELEHRRWSAITPRRSVS